MAEKILVIDDEETTLELIRLLLEHKGYEVIQATRADDGLRKAYRTQPDLVLLDIMMPDLDGWEVCRRLRELSEVPIIFMTALSEAKDIVKGLEMGADDYIIKPYDNDELIARVRAHLRRAPKTEAMEELIFDAGRFRINFLNREVYIEGEARGLTPKEFSLLSVMTRNPGRVITRQELVYAAWGPEYDDAVDNLKLYIHYLRKKIEKDINHPKYILTARGIGYRFANR